tara:strand:- start:7929 stop:8876 length:948 start_codon:yes stop_codon:yes gene_type:complete
MQLNGVTYSDRSNRPIVLSKVGLQALFISDGQYVDPYQISAVTIFSRDVNLYPSSILTSATQLVDTTLSSLVLMNFANSAALTTDTAFDTSNYTAGANASGIFRLGTGKYIVILDGTVNLSGVLNLDGINQEVANTTSATGDYIDVWTINLVAGSTLQTIINDFNLRKGNLTVITEPLMLKARSRLVNNKVTLGSKVDLKVATDIAIENTNIDESIKNLFRDTVITSGMLDIQKINEAANLPARVTVSAYSDTSSLVSMTADNVMILTWDTSLLSTHPQLLAGNFGSIQGVYAIRAKYSIFNETYVTDPMYLTLS